MEAKVEFGIRFKLYRQASGLTQEEYADAYLNGNKSYVSQLERGQIDIQVNSMDQHAKHFGVRYFQLANPDFPVPTLAEMPAPIRRTAAKAAKEREKAEADRQAKREAGKGVYKTGTAAGLHTLITSGFFKTPRTSREVYLKLNPGVEGKALTSDQSKAIGQITGTLSKGRFAKLLDKLAPLPGSTAVRFVEKSANQVGYTDGSGSTGIAADET